MANPITGSRYDEAATEAILKRKYGTAKPLETRIMPLVGGIGGAYREGARGMASAAKYVATGETAPEAPQVAVKPTTSTPSSYMQNLIQQGAGTVGLNRNIEQAAVNAVPKPAIGSQVPAYMNKANALAVAAPTVVDPQQARIKAYQDFMSGSLQRGKEAMARWKGEDGARMASPKAREEFARQAQREGAQREQANVAGEREAGVERFKAEKAAEGMVGAKEAATAGEAAGIRLKGEYDVKAAEAKAGATEGKDRAKMLKDYSMTLANSEPGSPAYQAAEAGLAELYGQKAETPVAQDATGKPVFKRNGKFVYADGTEYKKA